MVRVKSSVASKRRKKRVLKVAKGQFGDRSKRFRQAVRSVKKGLAYAYRDRKVKKRLYRNLWIVRINAACTASGMSYNRFINGLKKANVILDRKSLAEVAVSSPDVFGEFVVIARQALEADKGKRVKEAKAEEPVKAEK